MSSSKLKKTGLYVMTGLYTVAGINHFLHPVIYIEIIPPWLPEKNMLVFISGVFEILFGILLIPAATRRFAAWGIILLLVAVYPANIQMAVNYYYTHNPYFWLTVLRLPLQFLLIGWAYVYTKNKT